MIDRERLSSEFDSAFRQRTVRASTGKLPPPYTDAQERAYHRGVAALCSDRGYRNLYQAHALAALDCPARCPCAGCESTRREHEERRARRPVKRAA